jgi:hypothetical protein
MRKPRVLRDRALRKPPAPAKTPDDRPGTFHATSGFSAAERVDRRYEHGENNWGHGVPIIGFQPNQIGDRA